MGAEVKTIQALELPRPKEELEFCIKTLLALLGVRNFVLEYFFFSATDFRKRQRCQRGRNKYCVPENC